MFDFITSRRKAPRGRVFSASICPGLETFAAYGFNKSHAASYALISYQTAYLKAHYPQEFMAALMSLEMGDTNKTYKNIAECRLQNISVLPPDVNESDLYFTPVGESIRFGLAAIKNVGENTAKAIRESRLSTGPFKALRDITEKDKMAVTAVKVSIPAIIMQMAARREFGDKETFRYDRHTVGLPHPDGVEIISLLSLATNSNLKSLARASSRHLTSIWCLHNSPMTWLRKSRRIA